jgi:hypothetical protein
MLRYLLDEHISPDYARALRRRVPELTIWCIGDPSAPARGTPDPLLLEWCEAHDFILVTNNRRSMPRHLAQHLAGGRRCPGIFVLNSDQSMGDQLEDLALIALVSDANEYQDQIRHLPLT